VGQFHFATFAHFKVASDRSEELAAGGRVGEGFGLAVEQVYGVGPPAQAVIVWVERPLVVDVAQQVSPAALLGAVVVVVSGVEVADQRAFKLLA